MHVRRHPASLRWGATKGNWGTGERQKTTVSQDHVAAPASGSGGFWGGDYSA